MFVFNHGHCTAQPSVRPIISSAFLFSIFLPIPFVQPFPPLHFLPTAQTEGEGGEEERQKEEVHIIIKHQQSSGTVRHRQLYQQRPCVSSFARLIFNFSLKCCSCDTSDIKNHDRSKVAPQFLGRQTHCAAVRLFCDEGK